MCSDCLHSFPGSLYHLTGADESTECDDDDGGEDTKDEDEDDTEPFFLGEDTVCPRSTRIKRAQAHLVDYVTEELC